MLNVEHLSVRYGDLPVVDDVSFSVEAGEWLMLVGPNGAGKSTIVSALSGGAAYTGTVRLNGRDVKTLSPAARARDMGVLAQSHFVGYAFTVEEIVALGRYAYKRGAFSEGERGDGEKIDRALQSTGLLAQHSQSVLTLSGGELQRAFLAQVFAQEPRLLVLDEPTNHLDLKYQKQIFSLIAQWLQTPGRAVLSVVHDISLARAYGTRALLLNHGKVLAQGKMDEALNRDHLADAYDMDVYGWMTDMLSQWR